MLDVYNAGQAVDSYEYEHAAAHTDFDPYKAIADHDPDLASVVINLAAAGIGVAATVSIVRKGRRFAQPGAAPPPPAMPSCSRMHAASSSK